MKKKRKKKCDIYEQQKQRYWEAYDRAWLTYTLGIRNPA
jgi:hypothetical protein